MDEPTQPAKRRTPTKTATKRTPTDVRDLLRRLDVVERNQTDLSSSYTKFVDSASSHEMRLKTLEQDHLERRIDRAREEERDKNLMARLDRMDGKIGGIEANGSKLLWLVLGSVIVTVVGFVLSGGLKIT